MATSFYDRPITVPAWLKRLGASPLTALAGASLGAGALLKEGEEMKQSLEEFTPE